MVKLLESIKRRNLKKISSLLILLTVIVGVCSLLIFFSINEAGKREVLKNVKKAGDSCLLFLEPTFFFQNGKKGDVLSYTDISLVKNRVPQIGKIALWDLESIYEIKIDKIEYPPEGASHSMVPTVSGITPEFKEVMDIEMKEGRFVNETDLIYKRRVCVIGGRMYERLGGGNLLGKTLIVKYDFSDEIIKFTIIGVLDKKFPLFASLSDQAFTVVAPLLFKSSDKAETFQKQQKVIYNLAMNDSIYIPWTTWVDFIKEKHSVSSLSLPPDTLIPIKVKIPEGESVGKFVYDKENIVPSDEILSGSDDHDYSFLYYFPEKIKEVCDKMRKILKERWGEDKIFVFSYSGTFSDEIEIQTRESNRLLAIITVVALFFSGVILSGMMLISAHKRVGEIGVRRAFGARKKDIFWQFLQEGVMLYSIGIVIGLFVGIVVSYLVITRILSWEYHIPFLGVIISSIFVFLVGILSSLYPAMKAANVPPAQAVKYE